MSIYFNEFTVILLLKVLNIICFELLENEPSDSLDEHTELAKEEVAFIRKFINRRRPIGFGLWHSEHQEDDYFIISTTIKTTSTTYKPIPMFTEDPVLRNYTYPPPRNHTLIVPPFGGLIVNISPWLSITFRERGHHFKKAILNGNLNKLFEDDINAEYRGYFIKKIINSTENIWEFILNIHMEDGDAFHFWIHAVIDNHDFKTPHRCFFVKDGIAV